MTSAGLAVLIAQEDVARHCGSTMRVQFAAETLTQAGMRVITVGWASAQPLVSCGEVVVAPGRGAIGKLRAMLRGIALARSGATHAMLTSLGAPYNGFVAWYLRRCGVTVIYDAHDPVFDAIPMVFGNGALVRAGLPLVALSQRLLDDATPSTLVAGGPRFEARMRAGGWRGPMVAVLNTHGVASASASGERAPRPPEWDDAKIVVYTGGMQRWRGIATQIDAIALARKGGADVRLVLRGFFAQGDYAAHARSRGLADGALIEMREPLSVPAFHALLASCDFVVSSERVDFITQSSVCDALANGVRVISVDDGRDINTYFGEFFRYYDGTAADLARVLAECDGRMEEEEWRRARERLADLSAWSRGNLRFAFGLGASKQANPQSPGSAPEDRKGPTSRWPARIRGVECGTR
jgi:glycosyltransferase involved in cell wall biosynthesis